MRRRYFNGGCDSVDDNGRPCRCIDELGHVELRPDVWSAHAPDSRHTFPDNPQRPHPHHQLQCKFNSHELRILKDYTATKQLSANDVFALCRDKLLGGEFSARRVGAVADETADWDDQTCVCVRCAEHLLCDLAFQWRLTLAPEEFPSSVTDRPDCHWGKNCRTQFSRPHHAANFNHCCEQTRVA